MQTAKQVKLPRRQHNKNDVASGKRSLKEQIKSCHAEYFYMLASFRFVPIMCRES